MSIKFILAVLATGIFVSSLVFADDQVVYKVVGADGKVSFSNKPPAVADGKNKVEKVDVKSSLTNKTAVVQEGDNFFCGRILLPKYPNGEAEFFSSKKTSFYQELAYKKKTWESSIRAIDSTAHNVESYSYYSHSYSSSSQSKNNTPEKLEEARDDRCAIDWAEGKQAELAELKETLLAKIESNSKYIDMESGVRDRSCGLEPVYNPKVNDFDISQRRSMWSECVEPHQDRIDKGLAERDGFNKELELIYLAQQATGRR